MKLKAKYLIGFAFFYTGLLSLMKYWRKKVLKKGSFTILTYHRITSRPYGDPFLCVSPDNFKRQIRYLTQRYKVVSLTELVGYLSAGKPPLEDYAAITFDDGYKDNYTNAYPILKENRVPAIIFLVSGHIGTDGLYWWDRAWRIAGVMTSEKNLRLKFSADFYPPEIEAILAEISSGRFSFYQAGSRLTAWLKEISEDEKNRILADLERQILPFLREDRERPYSLTWEEIKEMSHQGISFGSHAVTHCILSRVKKEQAEYEISFSKAVIERETGRKVLHFSYPNGREPDFNQRIKQFIGDEGYMSASATIEGTNKPQADLFCLKRRAIDNAPLCVFASKLNGVFG